MVIRRNDRVATVLRADESLIEVFVGLSPVFERLRNPAMRKVMSRLVTVEQAARIAGVDPDELVARLNVGGESVAAPSSTGTARKAGPPDEWATGADGERPPVASERPAALAAVRDGDIVDVDVREDLRNGREPFSRIMAARRQVPSGGALRVRAIFEPVPLYAVMAKQGLTHHTERLGPDDWRVWFWAGGQAPAAPHRSAVPVAPGAPTPKREPERPAAPGEPARSAALAEPEEDVRVLDVRGLEPPEPMVRTLAAVEELPPGATLVQINVRVPRFLLPRLEERGFAYEVREQGPDLVRVFIRRAPGARG